MFCPNCGSQVADAARFCQSCGAIKDSVTTLMSERVTQPAQARLHKLLISDDGKGNPAIWFWCTFEVIIGVLAFLFLYWVAINQQEEIFNWNNFSTRTEFGPISKYFLGAGILVLVVSIIGAVVIGSRISNTKITVFDNAVVGIAVNKHFLLSGAKNIGFNLSYDQITSVETSGDSITIYASGAQYKCYVNNASEIQDSIHKQRSIIKNGRSNL